MFVIRKETKTHGILFIRPVEKALARDMIVTGHYSHKWQAVFGKYNFGIFRAAEPDKCLGVASYGLMKNPTARIFTSDVPDGWMIELNRMWIDDCLGKNAETILIGASIRLLRDMDPSIVAIQSFADGRIGCGTIYKASNFLYYGYHYTTFFRNKKTGEVTHEQNITDISGPSTFFRTNALLLGGYFETFKVKTYRYIYPLHKSFRFRGKGPFPYPPYEKGEHPATWMINPVRLRDRLVSVIDTLLERYPHKRAEKV